MSSSSTLTTATTERKSSFCPQDVSFLEHVDQSTLDACLLSDDELLTNGFPSRFDVDEFGFVTAPSTRVASPTTSDALLAPATRILAVRCIYVCMCVMYVSAYFHSFPLEKIDCEMATTKIGKELTRVTVVNSRFQVVYDSLCVPSADVLDYNTLYSGITKETLQGVRVKLVDVQRQLLSFVDQSTILVGHSLENDLRALRLCHRRVIDTVRGELFIGIF